MDPAKIISGFRRDLTSTDRRKHALPHITLTGLTWTTLSLIALPFARSTAIVTFTCGSATVIIAGSWHLIRRNHPRRPDPHSNGT